MDDPIPGERGGLFGIAGGIAAAVGAGFFARCGHRRTAAVLSILGGILLAGAALRPGLLDPAERAWSRALRAISGLIEAAAALVDGWILSLRRRARSP